MEPEESGRLWKAVNLPEPERQVPNENKGAKNDALRRQRK